MVLIGNQFIRDEAVEYTIDATARYFWIAVSDGMGGHQAGELASQTVLENMAYLSNNLPSGLDSDSLKKHLDANIRSIHQSINQMSITDPTRKGLGATFTGLLIYGEKKYIINIGDSRLYRLRGCLLACLTNDHSLRNLLNNPSIPQNHLANSFGGGSDKIFFDFDETTLLSGDIILLCTDGLNGELDDTELENLLNNGFPLSYIIDKARRNGGNDNISAVKIVVL